MIALVYRAPEFSPNDNVQKDAAILEAVGSLLEQKGLEVKYLIEDNFAEEEALKDIDYCICMARRSTSLAHLLQLVAHEKIRCFNNPASVKTTVSLRSATLQHLSDEGLPTVPFWYFDTEEKDYDISNDKQLRSMLPGWVKMMHQEGVLPGDVSFVQTIQEVETRINRFADVGDKDIIVTRHLEGPLQKMYVVGNQCWPDNEYASLAKKVGEVMKLDIYGVDLILTPEGPFIIDVNDFPSFSSCREEAAHAIAELVANNL